MLVLSECCYLKEGLRDWQKQKNKENRMKTK